MQGVVTKVFAFDILSWLNVHDMTRHRNVLENLIQTLNSDLQKKQIPLVVFDLDSTLFDVSPRIQKILEELRERPEIQEAYPDIIPYLKDIRTQRTDWGIKAALTRALAKAAHTPEEFKKAARDFWAQHFFSNEYLHFDHPLEGAVEFVNDLQKAGVKIAYLTGRDWKRMAPGTVEVLEKWGFPVPDRAELVMKPVQGSDDAIFKSGWFESLKPHQFSRVVFFENEPKILHEVRLKHPEVEIIFMETTHSGKAEPADDWIKIPHFLRS